MTISTTQLFAARTAADHIAAALSASFGFEHPVARNHDRLDFKDAHVTTTAKALLTAFNAGLAFAKERGAFAEPADPTLVLQVLAALGEGA